MLIDLSKKTYRTYKGDSARHRLRLFVACAVAIFMAAFVTDLEKSTFQIAALIVTVLTGFTFTALFSNYSITTSGLPTPRDETDRDEITLLKALGDNFSVRSRYFIVLALITLLIILASSSSLSIHFLWQFIKWFLPPSAVNFDRQVLQSGSLIIYYASFLCKAICLFTLFECFYTFYRLAETILSVLDTRKGYVDASVAQIRTLYSD